MIVMVAIISGLFAFLHHVCLRSGRGVYINDITSLFISAGSSQGESVLLLYWHQ